jgi:hypothetical protein
MSLFGLSKPITNPLAERRQDAVVLVLGVGLYVAVGLFEILTNRIKAVPLSTAVPWAFGIAVIPTLIILLTYFATSSIKSRPIGWMIFAGVYFFVLNHFYERFAEFIFPI